MYGIRLIHVKPLKQGLMYHKLITIILVIIINIFGMRAVQGLELSKGF